MTSFSSIGISTSPFASDQVKREANTPGAFSPSDFASLLPSNPGAGGSNIGSPASPGVPTNEIPPDNGGAIRSHPIGIDDGAARSNPIGIDDGAARSNPIGIDDGAVRFNPIGIDDGAAPSNPIAIDNTPKRSNPIGIEGGEARINPIGIGDGNVRSHPIAIGRPNRSSPIARVSDGSVVIPRLDDTAASALDVMLKQLRDAQPVTSGYGAAGAARASSLSLLLNTSS